ncbi:hypothetical protein MMC11_002177 [Xylographa trunciseda]|nr:hypothetical protein [Xylographa trunciseda]
MVIDNIVYSGRPDGIEVVELYGDLAFRSRAELNDGKIAEELEDTRDRNDKGGPEGVAVVDHVLVEDESGEDLPITADCKRQREAERAEGEEDEEEELR